MPRKVEFSLLIKAPDNKLLYSNVGDCEFGDFFSFLFFVNACRSNHTHVGASSSRDNISHGSTKSRVPNICLAAIFSESWSQGIFCT